MLMNSSIIDQKQYLHPSKLKVACGAYLTLAEKKILLKIAHSSTAAKSVSQRAHIILSADKGLSKYAIMKKLNIRWETVHKWINRWATSKFDFSKITQDTLNSSKLKKQIVRCLKDLPRRGSRSKFTPEQVVQIIHLGCTKPESINIPLSHWSSRSLAKQVVKTGITTKISHERVATFLKKMN